MEFFQCSSSKLQEGFIAVFEGLSRKGLEGVRELIPGIIKDLEFFLGSLAFALSAICLGAGCSKVFLGEKPDAEKNWICDNEADEAMKRNDYAAGISLHERFLEKRRTLKMRLLCTIWDTPTAKQETI